MRSLIKVGRWGGGGGGGGGGWVGGREKDVGKGTLNCKELVLHLRVTKYAV